MLSFDDDRWATLEGGYKTPYDPRPALARLRSRERTEEAWKELWNELHHQGDVGIASYACVPHLVDIYRDHDDPDWNTYGMVSVIEETRLGKGPDLPPWLSDSYQAALRSLIDLAAQDLSLTDDPLVIRSALGAIAIAKGLRSVGRLLSLYSDEELHDMEKAYFAAP